MLLLYCYGYWCLENYSSNAGEFSHPRPMQSKDQRVEALRNWRNSFSGFQYTGQAQETVTHMDHRPYTKKQKRGLAVPI